MGSLDIERFLNFGVGREEEVDENDGWYEEGEERICYFVKTQFEILIIHEDHCGTIDDLAYL